MLESRMGADAANFIANRLQTALEYGALWFDDVLCAAALAWLMPPVKAENAADALAERVEA